jgi:formylmethanofuran dehydrogenase subunit B
MTPQKLFPVVCAGCACLCDDVGITMQERRIVATEKACPRGEAFLRSLRHEEVRAFVQGKESSVQDAIAATIQILREAAMPAIIGMSESSLEAIRAAIALAEVLHGMIVPWPADPTRTWGQNAPDLSRSWAEIRACDLIVFWGVDPMQVQPRLVERLGGEGKQILKITEVDSDLFFVRSLRLHLEEKEPASGTVQFIVQELTASRRCHVFLNRQTALDEVIVDEWQLLAAHLVNKLRLSISPIAESVHVRGVTEMLTWLTGSPGPISFASGMPIYRPGVWDTERLFSAEMIDTALCLGPCPEGNVPRLWIDRQEHPGAEVCFVVPGLSPLLDAHVMRPDGIMLRLAGTQDAPPDPAALLLARLQEAVQ